MLTCSVAILCAVFTSSFLKDAMCTNYIYSLPLRLIPIIFLHDFGVEIYITQAEREGYIAIMMPRPADWLKVKASLVTLEDYKKLRDAR